MRIPWAAMTSRICRRAVSWARRHVNDTTYPLLKREEVVLSQRIRLRNHGNQVDTSTQTLHDLDVERLQTKSRR